MEQSDEYTWFLDSVLGSGASGIVYKGIEKARGEAVAVKLYRKPDLQDCEFREFKLLQRIEHENIVKLLKVETGLKCGGTALVMELCKGGSLAKMLRDPRNVYGLSEEEFFLFLGHLTSGMRYLRSNKIIHRDLKPENIMKFIKEDGTSVYKLIDFGAAKELKENDEFTSIYGTEEYLHPELYETAFPRIFKNEEEKAFRANIDLWSVGVTLYHAATGRLPFRPYGQSRRNRVAMFKITSKIGSGTISGIQTSDNGPIIWSKSLPKDCRLSTGLKKVITPVLAGILEAKKEKIWDFERFFSEVQKILTATQVDIFHVNKTMRLRVYLNEKHIQKLQDEIQYQTRILPQDQIILYKNRAVHSDAIFDDFPSISAKNPLLLFYREDDSFSERSIYNTYAGPKIDEFPKFENGSDILKKYEEDLNTMNRICSIIYSMQYQIENLSNNCDLIAKFVISWDEALKKSHDKQFAKFSAIKKLLDNLINMAIITDALISIADKPNMKKFAVNFEDLHRSALPFNEAINNLNRDYFTNDYLINKWKELTEHIKTPDMTRSKECAATFVEELSILLSKFRSRWRNHNIDEDVHALDKTRVTYIMNSIRRLFNECTTSADNLCEMLDIWYREAYKIYLNINNIDSHLNNMERQLEPLYENMSKSIAEKKDTLKPIVESKNVGSKNRIGVQELKEAVSEIKDVKKEFETMKSMQENLSSLLMDLQGSLETMQSESDLPKPCTN